MEIDIERPIPTAINFRWKEFLYLKQWDLMVHPTEAQAANIRRLAAVMERVRSVFNCAIIVTSGLRPEIYNKKIKGAQDSAHIYGLACDFMVSQLDGVVGCEYARDQLKPHLDNWKIRMEDKPDANWIHIDLREPGKTGRFFKP